MKTGSRKIRFVTTSFISILALSGCAYHSSSADVYSPYQAQREHTIRMGVVESVRAVKIDSNGGQSTGVGAVGGGALGAVAGSGIGGGRGALLSTIAGGIAGLVAGNAIEKRVAVHNGLEITVRLDNGRLRAITQEATGEVFRAGERVRLVSSGGITRVTH